MNNEFPDITFVASCLFGYEDVLVTLSHPNGAFDVIYHLYIPGLPLGQVFIRNGKWEIQMHLRFGKEDVDRDRFTKDDFDAIIERLPEVPPGYIFKIK